MLFLVFTEIFVLGPREKFPPVGIRRGEWEVVFDDRVYRSEDTVAFVRWVAWSRRGLIVTLR